MSRKRRTPKRRAPLAEGLAAISLCERARWSSYGPIIGDSDSPYQHWPDWATWAAFYGTVRAELFAARPWLRARSVADQIFLAWSEGQDPEAARQALLDRRAAADPRHLLTGGRDAA